MDSKKDKHSLVFFILNTSRVISPKSLLLLRVPLPLAASKENERFHANQENIKTVKALVIDENGAIVGKEWVERGKIGHHCLHGWFLEKQQSKKNSRA